MFCKNCGSEIKDHAYVCLKCGLKVVKNDVSSTTKFTGITLGIIAISLQGLQLLLMLTSILSSNKHHNQFGAIMAFTLLYVPCSIAVFILSVIGTVLGFRYQSKAGSIMNLITLIVCVLAFFGYILFLIYTPDSYNYYY